MRLLSVLACLLLGQIAYSIWQLSLCRQKQTNAISEQTCFSQVTGIVLMADDCKKRTPKTVCMLSDVFSKVTFLNSRT